MSYANPNTSFRINFQYAENTKLKSNLQQGRKRGYFVTRGENVVDVMAVASSLVLDNEVCGIAIAGPLHRMEPALTRHAELLLAAVRRITRERAK